MPMEIIAGSGEELLKTLYRQGLVVNHDLRRSIPSYVGKEQGTSRILTTTAKTGWHKSGAFVLPNNVIGGNDIRYQDSGKAATIFSSQGSLEAWQKEVAALCVGNPVLILSVCCALAGPLWHKSRREWWRGAFSRGFIKRQIISARGSRVRMGTP